METGSPGKRPVLPKRARLLVTAGMGMLALLLFGPRLVDIYVDWLWFGEVGFRSVWITVLLTRLAIVAAVALVVAGIVLAALLLAYRSRPFFVPDEPQRDPVAPLRSAVMRRPRLFGWGIAVTLGVVCGLIASFDWVKVQLFVHGGTFGIVDPEFGYDIGFFVFDLPFYRSVLNWLFVAVVLAFLASLLTHYLFGGLRLTTGRGMLTQAARVQLAVFAGAVVLLKAVAYWLDRYELLSSGRKEPTFTGAGYTDIHAELPAKLVVVAIAVLCAVSFFTAIFLRDLRIPAMAAALLVLSAILVGGLWPLLMEQFSVRPNAADVERPYIQRNIEATREAYRIGGDWVQYRSYPGIGTKQPRDVPVDVTTIAKVRLLDPHILSPKTRFPTSCVPTSVIRRTFSRSNVACWPSIMSTNRESSSPPTPSGRCPATRPTTLTPLNRRSTSSSATSRAPSRPSGWRRRWLATTANSSPRTSRRTRIRRTTAS